ncbi:mobile mystery protein B [Nitrobacter winogradskyi]|uniref:Fic-DOC domain mobile mystery protein B n=2 Tax=Nitrobacter winogradskyi TaxID=913 RepID=A0ACC6ANF6_NITWI|nr:mobile mystery protein B [Nitrobacter winogradskyi]MCP2001181.1 Fic-DOC domain mobile mystery protein B [Nitrobacter winogradskyi]GEC17467.1 cell filamentation protein [Nitrobacter winogradskyi]
MTGLAEYPEGATPLDPNELGGLKFKHITTREELDELEQANIESGLQWLGRHRGDVLTDDFAVTLHKRLFGEVWDWAGTFRKTGKNIGVDPIHIPVQLRTLMDDAQYWSKNKTYPELEAAARFHHRLVQIHPFPNGNGRHSRIMADTMLERVYGAKPIDWAGGYDLQKMNDRRATYIVALKAADAGNITPLIDFCSPRGGH